MRGHCVLIVLLFAVSYVAAQFPAVPLVQLEKTLAFGTTLSAQQLPPCYSVNYVVSGGTYYATSASQISANVFFLEFSLSEATSTVSVELCYRSGSTGELIPIPITSQFVGSVGGNTYDNCNPGTNAISAVDEDNCGVNYYCSSLIRQLANVTNPQLIVRVTTTYAESEPGITFSLTLTQRIIPVTITQLGSSFTTSNIVSPVGVPQFVPSINQVMYYVQLKPASTDRIGVATYLAQSSGLTQVQFRLSNINVNGLADTEDWSLAINERALAVINIANTQTTFDCSALENITRTVSSLTDDVVIRIPSCDNLYTEYFISVGVPADSQAWTYTLTTSFVGTSNNQDFSTYVPTFVTISANNTIVPSMVGNGYYYNYYDLPYQASFFFLNIQSTSDSLTNMVVTIFGITRTRIEAAITKNTLGLYSYCNNANDFVSRCQNGPYANYYEEYPIDYCKMTVTNCEFSSSNYYFLSVTGTGGTFSNYQYYSGIDYESYDYGQITTSFSVLVQVTTINPIAITSLPGSVVDGFTVYTDISAVANQAYNHYIFALTPAMITPSTHIRVEFYSVNEQTPVTLYMNYNSLAGNVAENFNYVLDQDYYNLYYNQPQNSQCLSSIWSCTTVTDRENYYDSVNTCFRNIPYCDLIANGASSIYFSVYGAYVSGVNNPKGFNNYEGYNRSVSYTLKVSYRNTAELLFDRITNVQHLPRTYTTDRVYPLDNNQPHSYSHQFMFSVPKSSSQSVISQVRFRLHDFFKTCYSNEVISLYLQCNNPTGECPCYLSQQSCEINDVQDQYCDVTSNLCSCPTGNFYLSVVVSHNGGYRCQRPYAYQITPFLVSAPIADTIYTNELGVNNVVTYSDVLFQNIPFDLTGYAGQSLGYYFFPQYYSTSQQVYQIINNAESTTDLLNVRVKYGVIAELDPLAFVPIQISRGVVAFDDGCLVSFCTGWKSDFQSEYYQPSGPYGPQAYWCQTTVQSCFFTQDVYYVRLFSWTTNFLLREDVGYSALSKQTIDYTLEISVEDNSAVALSLNVPIHAYVQTETYAHYSIDVTTVPTNSWLRISAYLNQDTSKITQLFLNYDSLAGQNNNYGSCFNSISRCLFGSYRQFYSQYTYYGSFSQEFSNSQYCDFFFEPCDIPSTGSIYVSIWGNWVVEVENSLEYTIIAESQSIIQLNSAMGYPTTGLLLYNQVAYYSFTLDPSDFRPFVIQLQSIEPYATDIPSGVLETTFSSVIPGTTTTTGACDCTGTYKYDAFSTIIYNCGDITNQPQYMTIRNTLESYYTPVSYTVRAYYHNRYNMNLNVQNNVQWDQVAYTQIPQSLNYNEVLDVVISSTQLQSNALYIGISDVSYTNTSENGYDRSLIAYLSFGRPGSPECNSDTIIVRNTIIPNPENVLMGVIQIPPCSSCSGTYYLSIYAQFYEPQPLNRLRLNFTVAAWTQVITTPIGFPTNIRSTATDNGGATFTFNQPNTIITCDDRFGNEYYIDYFFITPSIQTNTYETFKISYPTTGSVSSTYFDLSTIGNGCSFCRIDDGQTCTIAGCTTATNNIIYGTFARGSCGPNNNNVTVSGGISLNFEIDDSQIFTTTTQTINPSSTTSITVAPRVIAQYTVSFSSVDFSTWPEFDLSASINSGSGGVCYTAGSTGVAFPPPTLCPGVCNTQSIALDPCCYDSTDSYTVTVYNSDTTTSLTGTITATLTPISLGSEVSLSLGNTVPTPTSFATASTGLYKFIRFQLTSSNWNSDSVLVIQVFNAASTGGSRTVYLNYARYGGQSSDSVCLQNIAQLCSTGSGNCNVQLPAGGCTSSPLVNGYGTYFLSIVSDTASTSTTTTALIYAQTTNVYTTSVTGNVPQISQATNEFYTHFKFAIVRTIGDSSFEALDRRYQIRLTYTDTTQDLVLNIHNPWFYPTANILAGDNTQPIFGSCQYTDDPDWTCVSDSTSDTCTVPLCLTTGSNPYIYSQGSNKFVYVSARNLNSSPSVTSFTITNSIVSFGTMPTDEPVYFVNSISQPTDTIFTSACSTSSTGTSGGCQYSPSSTVSTVYFTLPISTLTWKSTDMFLFNFTQISSNANSFNVYLWTDSQCEQDAEEILPTTSCFAESTACWTYFSQDFSSLFKTDSGAGATTPFTFTIYLRVEGLDSTTAFNFQSRIYSPFSATTTLTPTNLAYTNNLLSWTGRQISFNVITPATSNYNLLINARASCYDSAPALLYTTLNYQWPTLGEDTVTLDDVVFLDGTQPSPIVLNSCGIVVGGNNYFTIATETTSNPIHPIAQVQLYFSASLDYPFEEQTLPWNNAYPYSTGSSSQTFSFVHIAQGENFGSQVDFALRGCPSCSLKVITPFYRQNLVESAVSSNSLEPNIYTPFSPENVEYISTGSQCVSAACSSANGVFCLNVGSSNTGIVSLSIPTCQFTNGRYFVYLTVPANYVFGYASVLTERDYALLRPTISNPKVVLYDTITPGPASLLSSITRYQFYQVVADRQSSFYVKMIIDINWRFNGDTLVAYAQPGFQSLFSTQTSTIGTSTASCSSLSCSTTDSNRPCYMYDFLCNSPTVDVQTINYFVGIRTSNTAPCTPISFTFTVITREPRNYRLISNNIPVCDQIETYSNVIPYSGFYRDAQYVPNNAFFYQVDTIGLNLQFATLTVEAIQNNLNSALPINIYFGNLPARCQTNCALGPISVSTDLSTGNQGSITCGLGPQIWITAFTDSSVEGRTDYQLVASITERPISSVSSNSVTTITGSQTFAITNTGIITSISAIGATIHSVALSDKPVNVGCSNLAGCPDLRSCQWLSQSTTYNVLVDKTTSSFTDQCGDIIGTTNTLSVVSITPTVLSETTIYSLNSGQLNVFTRTFNVSEQTVNSQFRVRIGALTSGQNSLNVYIGCNGAIAPGDSTCNYYVDEFDTGSTLTSSWITLCDTCTTAYITVQAVGCDIDRFQIVVDFEPNYLPSTGVALTNSWQSGAIQKWAITEEAQTNYWSFTSGSDGFIHIGIGNANNTNPSLPPNPILELTVYLKGCIVAQCTTGLASNSYPSRFDFTDKSCFVNFAAPVSGLTYIAAVSNPTTISSYASGAFYRAQAFNSFTDIATGSSSTNYQIQGRARHYYKTTAINSNGLASVVIHLNILDGPRLLVQVADSPNFIFNQNSNSQDYNGWVQSKICPFGECTIEIPTYASHPGVNTLYVWVTPAATSSDDMHDVIEKPTNYRIFSTVGVQNCGPISTAVPRTGFCSNVTVASASNGFWLYRDASIRVQDASGRYDALIDRCPIPTSQCRTYLNRFACLMVFRECDAQGFIVSQCRGDCQSAVNVCGPWYDATPSCNQQYPQLECSNSRYLDNEPCTGDLTNTPSSGGYDFGLPGSINTTPSPAPAGGQIGGGFNVSPVPSPSNVPITPDQEEPPIGRSPSKDCLLSPTPSPATVFIPPSFTPTVTASPPTNSASRFTVTMSFLLAILSMLWLAL